MMASATPIVDLNGQWVEEAFRNLDDRNYRRSLYSFLRKHGRHAVLRIIMVTVEMKRSRTMIGENAPFFGKTHTEAAKAKISAARIERLKDPENHPMFGKFGKDNPNYGKTHTARTKAKQRAALIGKNSPHWQGGKSFEPYCSRFNEPFKEQIRNRDNRICVLCGKSEIQNGQRLSVHHIDADKMQGCNGKRWHLCALCRSCNSKSDTIEKEFLIVSNLRSPEIVKLPHSS